MSVLILGNAAPHEASGGVTLHHRNAGGDTLHRSDVTVERVLDPRISGTTDLVVDDDTPIERLLLDVAHAWPHHSAGDAPSYVTGDNAEHVAAIRAHFGLPDPPAGEVMLLTNAGLDHFSAQAAGAASATAVAKWIALTANATAASVSDTTLTAEITTGGGGLVRGAALYAHTAAASTYTLTLTFTANGSDSLPVTIAKLGNFNAASAGGLVFETVLGTTATLSVSGDSLAVTWTITV